MPDNAFRSNQGETVIEIGSFKLRVKGFLNWLVVIGALIAFVASIYQGFQKDRVDSDLATLSHSRIDALTKDVDYALKRIEHFEQAIDTTETLAGPPPLINSKLRSLDSSIKAYQKELQGIRQAFNPVQPTEVLSIARLTDQIKLLAEKMATIESDNRNRQTLFEESIKRELAGSDKSTNIILIVLIPLVLNFLYTLWSDYRKKQEEKRQRTTLPNS